MMKFGKVLLTSLLGIHYVVIYPVIQNASIVSVVLFLLGLVGILLGRLRFIPKLPFRTTGVIAALLFANITLELSSLPKQTRNNIAIVGGSILTGLPDAPILARGTVLIDHYGTIIGVGESDSIAVPDGYELIDASGKFVMPGLINAHSHLFQDAGDPDLPMDLTSMVVPGYRHTIDMYLADSYLGKRYLAAIMRANVKKELYTGVTTLRSIGDINFLDVALRDAILSGEAVGPNLLVAGKILAVTGGHAADIGLVFNGPIEARRAVRELLRNKVDFVKITSTGGVADSKRLGEAGELQMTPEEIRAITDEAHRKNILVAAHAESTAGVKEALLAGVDNIEHGAVLDAEMIELFRDNPNSLRGFTSLHPTLSVFASGPDWTDETRADPDLSVIGHNLTMVGEQLIKGFQQAVNNNVLVGLGTDSGFVSHESAWKELKLFVELGKVSPEMAIHMGTLATAQSIGIADQSGSLEVGKRADLLVVDGDPRVDLSLIGRPSLISVNGYIHHR
ncbi:MAG: amidohydrolase family protein [Halioglobus sp.]